MGWNNLERNTKRFQDALWIYIHVSVMNTELYIRILHIYSKHAYNFRRPSQILEEFKIANLINRLSGITHCFIHCYVGL